MKRIYSIDCLKLYFAYVIAFGHFGSSLPGGSFAVKLFFVISGFFLAKKFYSKSYISNDVITTQQRYDHKQYTVDHIKILFPHYLFSFIIILLYHLSKYFIDILNGAGLIPSVYLAARTVYSSSAEILMLNSIGFVSSPLNYPVWQICAMLICGYFIYAFMYYSEKLSADLLFPIAFILFETYWITGRDPFAVVGCISAEMLRGFAMMALGVIIFKFTRSNIYTAIKSYKIAFNAVSLFMIIGMFVFGRLNGIHIICFAVILLYLYDPDCLINKLVRADIFKGFGNLSYAVYLNHAFVIYIFRDILELFNISLSASVQNIIFAVILTIYSVFTVFIVEKIKRRFLIKQ